MDKKKKVWEVFPRLVSQVREDHIRNGACGRGHDILHAFAVAHYAVIIAEDERTGLLAMLGGLLHNTDRVYSDEAVFRRKTAEYLEHPDLCFISRAEKVLVFEAVLAHSELNDPDDNRVCVALKDADRLTGAGATVLVRAGQFFHAMPIADQRHIDISDPEATFKDPKSVLRNLEFLLEWEGMLRLPKAKAIAMPRFALLRLCIEDIKNEVKNLSLDEYTSSIS